VEHGGGDPLPPGAPLIQQILIQPDQGSRLQHVGRRDPALRQITGQQMGPHVPGVGLIRLGVPLLPAQGGGLRGLGQVRGNPRRQQFLRDIAPPGAPLQREVHILTASEAGQPGPQMLPVSRGHPAPLYLAGHGVEVLEGQLTAMHVERAYDAHRDLPELLQRIGTRDLIP
jgi:hypothetical protein